MLRFLISVLIVYLSNAIHVHAKLREYFEYIIEKKGIFWIQSSIIFFSLYMLSLVRFNLILNVRFLFKIEMYKMRCDQRELFSFFSSFIESSVLGDYYLDTLLLF